MYNGLPFQTSHRPKGACVRAETLWGEWFTVNSVFSLNDVLVNRATSSEQYNPANGKNMDENITVNRINKVTEKHPIRKRDKRNSR